MILKKLIEIKREVGYLVRASKSVHGTCRSVYDTYNAVHDSFLKHGIIMTPGGLVNGNLSWTFHCAEDGSKIETLIPMPSELKDYFDSGKSISYSQKYAIISVLALPDKSADQSDPDMQDDKLWVNKKFIAMRIHPDSRGHIYKRLCEEAAVGGQTVRQYIESLKPNELAGHVDKLLKELKTEGKL